MKEVDNLRGAGGGGGSEGRAPIESKNTLQSYATARLLDLIAFGPIKGLVNGKKSVYLNGTPLENEDGTENFSGVTLTPVNGTPNQEVIPGFTGVENFIDVSTEVRKDSPVVRSVTNSAADAVVVTIQLQSLNRSDNDYGDLKPHRVTILIEWRVNGGAWNVGAQETISGKTMSAWQKSYRIDFQGAQGSIDLRMTRVSKDDDQDSRRNSSTYFASFTEVIDRKFNYPDMAMVGIELDAREFGNNLPSREYDIDLSIVQVPTNYDPETREYNGLWDGSFKWAWTDNPAWCYYDLATHPIIGANVPNTDKWALYRIAQYCDELVPDGLGGMEPRFTFNTIFSRQEDAVNALSTIASAFRGMAYWGSDSLVPVADMPEDPIKLVTPANVIDGEFTYSGTSLLERHSVAIVSFIDPDQGYEKTPAVYEDPDSIREFGWRELKVDAVACTSRSQALRLGKWMLDSERTERETVTYKAAIDHADLRPGNIIKIADPDRAGARMGGRLISCNGVEVTIDKTPDEVGSGTWYLTSVLPTGAIEKREIADVEGQLLTLVSPFSSTPVPGAVWVLSSTSLELPEWRVVSVSESDGGVYTVTATEYDRSKYARVELGLRVPTPPPSLIPTGPIAAPNQINIGTSRYLAGGTLHQKLVVSWPPSNDPRVVRYLLEVRGPEEEEWRTAYTGGRATHEELDIDPGEWNFRVRAESGRLGLSSAWASLTTNISSELEPAAPDSVEVSARTLSITLTPKSLNPGAQYEFWRSDVPLSADIEVSAVYLTTGPNFVDTGRRPGTIYYYYVRGVNAYGVSAWYPVQAETEVDVNYLLEALENQISQTQLDQNLSERIDLAAGSNEALMDRVLDLEGGQSDLTSKIDDALAGIEQSASSAYDALSYALIASDHSVAAQGAGVVSRLSEEASEIYATESEQHAQTSDSNRIAAETAASNAAYEASQAVESASSAEEAAARAESSESLVVQAKLDAEAAASASQDVQSSVSAMVSDVESVAEAVEQARLQAESNASSAETFAGQSASAASTAEGWAAAAAQDFTTLSARLDDVGGGISIEQAMSATADNVEGLSSQWSVKIDANGQVAGFGLSSTSPTYDGQVHSTMLFRVDTFAIGAPGASELAFVVEDGQVVMDGAFIKSLAANKIEAGTIDVDLVLNAAHINGGSLNINNKAQIDSLGNATLNNAYVRGDVQASSLKANTVMVDTLHLAGQAVTTPSSSYISGTISLGSSWKTVAQLSFTSTGAPVRVSFSADSEPTNYAESKIFRVLVNGSVAFTTSPRCFGAYTLGAGIQVSSIGEQLDHYISSPPAGTLTVVVQGKKGLSQDTGGGDLSRRILTCIEMKR